MISWIVATNNRAVLERNLLASLDLAEDDELVVVDDAESITKAYAEGQARATQPVRVYVHSDVQILHLPRLVEALEVCHRPDVGIMGLIGSRDVRMPWWDGQVLGSVIDGRFGTLNFGPGGECSIVDGLLLATTRTVEWDTDWPGWHGYDHDACTQMLRRGYVNWCLTGGCALVRHNTTSTSSMGMLVGWDEAMARYRAKWASHAAPA